MSLPQDTSFQIEDLELASTPLAEKTASAIIDDLAINVKCHSEHSSTLVHYKSHAFLNGMYQAYADHLPFVLSPDMIWLLICQGFANHVNFNSEKLRQYFVDFKGKQTIVIQNNELLDFPEEWRAVLSYFQAELSKYVKGDLVDTLTPKFSTTDLNARVACQIAILDTFKSYFEYVVLTCVCGIPSITLEGEISDWELLMEKVKGLAKYHLQWWVNELMPVLEEFVNAKKGQINIPFWRNMFKVHHGMMCGDNDKIDGWIATFFPYDKYGDKTNFTNLELERLPAEISCVDFIWEIIYPRHKETIPMNFMSGFIGLRQDEETMALRPEVGWIVCEAAKGARLEDYNMHRDAGFSFSALDTIPEEVYDMKSIGILELDFKSKVHIPYKLGKVAISELYIGGKVSKKEYRKIQRLFPLSSVIINDNYIQGSRNPLYIAFAWLRQKLCL